MSKVKGFYKKEDKRGRMVTHPITERTGSAKVPQSMQIYKTTPLKLPEVLEYDGKSITIAFDGRILKNQIEVVPHEKWCGSWSRTENKVYVDDDLPQKYLESISIHESLEKYFREEYDLDENAEGHELADEIEKKLFLKRYPRSEWDDYSKVVERVHRKEMRHAGVGVGAKWEKVPPRILRLVMGR